MVQAERVVPNSVIRKNPFMTTIAYADCVVEAPYGGHPYAAHGFYKEDVEFIQDYVKCSEANRKGDEATWDDYLEAPRPRAGGHYAYLDNGRHQEAARPLHPSDRQPGELARNDRPASSHRSLRRMSGERTIDTAMS